MRGGISYISKRFSKSNNKYMKFYDSGEDNKYVMYLDTNNLYGYAMSQYLPFSGFKCLNKRRRFDVKSIGENSSDGYILEVDLNYPDDLQELHNDYPLTPKKLT